MIERMRLPHVATLLALAVAAGVTRPLPGQDVAPRRDSLTITFLANEGVMLSSGGTRVLIDALFGDGLPRYGAVSPATRTLLERAAPPFEGVDVVLATHIHADHFDAAAVLRHLQANPGGRFVSPSEVVARLREEAGADVHALASRTIGVELAPGERRRMTAAAGVTIHALGLPHGKSGKPANIGFVVDLGGRRILHVGDSDAEAKDFAELRLAELGIDVALLHIGYLDVPARRDIVRGLIRPSAIGVVHLEPPSALARWSGGQSDKLREIQAEFPSAKLFLRELDTMVIR